MKIAVGIYRLHPRGGLEDNCIRIAEELARRGHEPTLFVAGPHSELSLPIVPVAPCLKRFSNHNRLAAFAKGFVKATDGKFDRTVSFQPVPGADFVFLADTLRDRADTPLLKRLSPRFRTFARLERGCFGSNAETRIIGLALPQMHAFAERYPASRQRIAIIPPTMHEARRRPELRGALREAARVEMGFEPDTPVWLWLGLQPETKGLDRVIQALSDHPRAHLLVGGLLATSSKIRRHLKRATDRGVVARIHCLGYLSGDRFFSTLASADVLAHPARLDVTGGVILEALVNGLPVVATDVCGFAKHVEASGAGSVVRGPFDRVTFSGLLGQVGRPGENELSHMGVSYGANPQLFSGIEAACDLIEANHWETRSDV